MDELPPKKRPRFNRYELTGSQINSEEDMTALPTPDNQNSTSNLSHEALSEDPIMNAIPQQEIATTDSDKDKKELDSVGFSYEVLKRTLQGTMGTMSTNENIEIFAIAGLLNRTEDVDTQEDVLNEKPRKQNQQMPKDNLNEESYNIATSKLYLKPAEDANVHSHVDNEESERASSSGTFSDGSQESKTEMETSTQDTNVAGPSGRLLRRFANYKKIREYILSKESIASVERNIDKPTTYFTQSTSSRKLWYTVNMRAPIQDSDSSSSDETTFDENPESSPTVTSSSMIRAATESRDVQENDAEETATASSPEVSSSSTSSYYTFNRNYPEEETAEEQNSASDHEVETDDSECSTWTISDGEQHSLELNSDVEWEIAQVDDDFPNSSNWLPRKL